MRVDYNISFSAVNFGMGQFLNQWVAIARIKTLTVAKKISQSKPLTH